jgi:hypothetical protein
MSDQNFLRDKNMFTEEQRIKVQKAILITIIVLGLVIFATLLKRHLSTPSDLRKMPPGVHECIGKNGLVYSKQPCMPGETTVEKPKK